MWTTFAKASRIDGQPEYQLLQHAAALTICGLKTANIERKLLFLPIFVYFSLIIVVLGLAVEYLYEWINISRYNLQQVVKLQVVKIQNCTIIDYLMTQLKEKQEFNSFLLIQSATWILIPDMPFSFIIIDVKLKFD